MPARIDAEIARDQRRIAAHPAHREAVGDEAALEAGLQLLAEPVGLDRLDMHDRRGQHDARHLGQPVGGEIARQVAVERIALGFRHEERVGDEFGVDLPFQHPPGDLPAVMDRVGGRMRRAVAFQQRHQMRAVHVAVAVDGLGRRLDGEADREAGRLDIGKRPCMQLVRELVASGMILQRQFHRAGLRHGRLPDNGTDWRN